MEKEMIIAIMLGINAVIYFILILVTVHNSKLRKELIRLEQKKLELDLVKEIHASFQKLRAEGQRVFPQEFNNKKDKLN